MGAAHGGENGLDTFIDELNSDIAQRREALDERDEEHPRGCPCDSCAEERYLRRIEPAEDHDAYDRVNDR